MTIFRSRLPLKPVPEESIWEYLFGGVSFDDARVVYKECNTRGRSISLGALKLEAQRLGEGLRARAGLKPGEVVLFILPNTIDFIVALFASQFAGLQASFANPSYMRHELRHVYHTLQPKRIITTGALLGKVSKAGLPWNRCIIMDTDVGNSTVSARSLLVAADEARQARAERIADLDQTAYLPWSSGTTGLPKAVEISHRNVVAMLTISFSVPDMFDVPRRMITCLPFFHAYALIKSVHLAVASKGSCLFILPGFNAINMCDTIRREKIELLPAVPPMLNVLLNTPQAEQMTSLHHISCGAAPLDAELQSRVEKKVGVQVLQGYGMSETTVGVLGLQPGAEAGTVGGLLPGVEARLVDDDGRDVAPGERGELLLRGPNITKGYFQNASATEETFADGWLKTGDIAIANPVTEEFSIVDRKKELIKYKGFQVAPAELEALLIQHPLVAVAAVVGVYDKSQTTELPRAYVQLKPSASRGRQVEEDIAAFVKARTSHHKQLRGGVRVLDVVPVSASGKILRKQIRLLVADEEAQIQAKL